MRNPWFANFIQQVMVNETAQSLCNRGLAAGIAILLLLMMQAFPSFAAEPRVKPFPGGTLVTGRVSGLYVRLQESIFLATERASRLQRERSERWASVQFNSVDENGPATVLAMLNSAESVNVGDVVEVRFANSSNSTYVTMKEFNRVTRVIGRSGERMALDTQGDIVAFPVLKGSSRIELGFSRSLSHAIFEKYGAKFGAEALSRLRNWQGFLESLKRPSSQTDELAILDKVNSFFNLVPFSNDLKQWGIGDYWATPAEMVASNGADCEDYAIAKYFALKELGIPIDRLMISYVKIPSRAEAHMVLAYFPRGGAVPLILDNLQERIVPAAERADLIPIYSFNDDFLQMGLGDQPSKKIGDADRIENWRDLLIKLRREQFQ
jgi:predicted transglutaminase-like cysteine proteinase